MKRDLMIPKVTFRVRTGDEVETDGGCAIGGQWVNKTTDDYLKHFGISNLSEMPTSDEVTELLESEHFS